MTDLEEKTRSAAVVSTDKMNVQIGDFTSST